MSHNNIFLVCFSPRSRNKLLHESSIKILVFITFGISGSLIIDIDIIDESPQKFIWRREKLSPVEERKKNMIQW